MVNWLKRFFTKKIARTIDERKQGDKPWAIFEITDFAEDGRVKVEFDWNAAFIAKADSLGFTAETPEDTVQMFFYTSQMKPTSIFLEGGDEAVQAEGTPRLSSPQNRIST